MLQNLPTMDRTTIYSNKNGQRLKKLFSFLFVIFPGIVFCQNRVVDFKFAPANYLTAICLPDDWLKTLVWERGALAYDFGPGPYARPLTENL